MIPGFAVLATWPNLVQPILIFAIKGKPNGSDMTLLGTFPWFFAFWCRYKLRSLAKDRSGVVCLENKMNKCCANAMELTLQKVSWAPWQWLRMTTGEKSHCKCTIMNCFIIQRMSENRFYTPGWSSASSTRPHWTGCNQALGSSTGLWEFRELWPFRSSSDLGIYQS